MTRAWRLVAATALVLAACAVLLSVVLFTQQAHERARNVRVSCEDVNRRHDATLKQLDALIAKIPDGPRRDRAKQGRASTVLLINALVPKRDCDALVSKQVSQ